MAGVTGDTEDPTRVAWRFSPESNQKRLEIRPEQELDVLISTDVLSEGAESPRRRHYRKLRSPMGHHSAYSEGRPCG